MVISSLRISCILLSRNECSRGAVFIAVPGLEADGKGHDAQWQPTMLLAVSVCAVVLSAALSTCEATMACRARTLELPGRRDANMFGQQKLCFQTSGPRQTTIGGCETKVPVLLATVKNPQH